MDGKTRTNLRITALVAGGGVFLLTGCVSVSVGKSYRLNKVGDRTDIACADNYFGHGMISTLPPQSDSQGWIQSNVPPEPPQTVIPPLQNPTQIFPPTGEPPAVNVPQQPETTIPPLPGVDAVPPPPPVPPETTSAPRKLFNSAKSWWPLKKKEQPPAAASPEALPTPSVNEPQPLHELTSVNASGSSKTETARFDAPDEDWGVIPWPADRDFADTKVAQTSAAAHRGIVVPGVAFSSSDMPLLPDDHKTFADDSLANTTERSFPLVPPASLQALVATSRKPLDSVAVSTPQYGALRASTPSAASSTAWPIITPGAPPYLHPQPGE